MKSNVRCLFAKFSNLWIRDGSSKLNHNPIIISRTCPLYAASPMRAFSWQNPIYVKNVDRNYSSNVFFFPKLTWWTTPTFSPHTFAYRPVHRIGGTIRLIDVRMNFAICRGQTMNQLNADESIKNLIFVSIQRTTIKWFSYVFQWKCTGFRKRCITKYCLKFFVIRATNIIDSIDFKFIYIVSNDT